MSKAKPQTRMAFDKKVVAELKKRGVSEGEAWTALGNYSFIIDEHIRYNSPIGAAEAILSAEEGSMIPRSRRDPARRMPKRPWHLTAGGPGAGFHSFESHKKSAINAEIKSLPHKYEWVRIWPPLGVLAGSPHDGRPGEEITLYRSHHDASKFVSRADFHTGRDPGHASRWHFKKGERLYYEIRDPYDKEYVRAVTGKPSMRLWEGIGRVHSLGAGAPLREPHLLVEHEGYGGRSWLPVAELHRAR